MDNFAAIDFETANNERTSVCSVGVVIVKDGEIVDKFYSLIHPEPDYYLYWNTRVHGLTREDTANAPVFSEVWKQVEPKITGLPLVEQKKTKNRNDDRWGQWFPILGWQRETNVSIPMGKEVPKVC